MKGSDRYKLTANESAKDAWPDSSLVAAKKLEITELRACNKIAWLESAAAMAWASSDGSVRAKCDCKMKQWHCRINGFCKLWKKLDKRADQTSMMRWALSKPFSICSPHAVASSSGCESVSMMKQLIQNF
jgi:hypothetical protein